MEYKIKTLADEYRKYIENVNINLTKPIFPVFDIYAYNDYNYIQCIKTIMNDYKYVNDISVSEKFIKGD